MKKMILVPALLGVMGIGGTLAIYGENLIGSANNEKLLTLEQIEKKALAEVKGQIRDIEFERNAVTSYYDVEVVTKDAEYDLKFDAVSGKLLFKTKDFLDFDDTYENDYYNIQTAPSQKTATTNQQASTIVNETKESTNTTQPNTVQPNIASPATNITQQQAIEIALAKVNGTVTGVELDDGYEYDIEIVSGQFEYDFEINATTGTITKMEQDYLND